MSFCQCQLADGGNAKRALQIHAMRVPNVAASSIYKQVLAIGDQRPESSTLLALCLHLSNHLQSISSCWLLPRALLHLSLALRSLARKSSFPGLLCLCIKQGLLSLDMTAACKRCALDWKQRYLCQSISHLHLSIGLHPGVVWQATPPVEILQRQAPLHLQKEGHAAPSWTSCQVGPVLSS